MKCAHCNLESTYVNGSKRYCDKHYRFQQMRQDSVLRLQLRHTRDELEAVLPEDMKCPRCQVDMIWRRKTEQKGVTNQITLQHWRDGTIGFLCLRCNTQHASMEGDSFREMPVDHKFCPICQTVKHESEFGVKNSRAVLKRNSCCKVCNKNKNYAYRENRDKEQYNAIQRAYRAKRKAAGNPVRRKKNVDGAE